MNEIELALEYARKKKSNRLMQNKIYRRKIRSQYLSSSYLSDLLDIEQSITTNISSIKPALSYEQRSMEDNISSASPKDNNNNEEKISENIDSPSLIDKRLYFDDIFCHQKIFDLNLHSYTIKSCFSFAKSLIDFIRRANVSKNHADHLVNLIQSVLPQPNIFPKTYSGILDLLSVENVFIKRVVCITCKTDLLITSKICSKCPRDNLKRLAFILDSIQETIFIRVYDRLCSTINTYRQTFTKQEIDKETNDIVYNKNYKLLRDCIHHPFISIVIHLDGIDLDKSKTQHLWILSCSIVELPPVIRTQRHNNIILSLWISKEQPDINLWLDRCFTQLTNLKVKGFPSRTGDQIIVKVYGVIGDTPALNLILNHKSHVGYNCCWYCNIVGVHIYGKRQYYYDENIPLRSETDFAVDSKKAQSVQEPINGRHGISILEKIVDIPLPRSIIADYLHITLLGHAKSLLHGRPAFAHQTADIAHKLLTTFYRDHETFYDGLQNFVLHIHNHFADLYKNHGSLCNINTFSQEDLMGVISKLKHGTNFWADQLIFYLNIDFALRNEKKYEESTSSILTAKGVFDNTSIPGEFVQNSDNSIESMAAQSGKRVSRPRKIFSPSENLNRPSHFLLHFDSTDSYNIALCSSIKNILGDKATLNIRGKKTVATVIASGTLESCENEQRKITRASQQASDDNNQFEASNYDENEDINTVSASQKEDLACTLSLSNRQAILDEKHHNCYQSDDESTSSILDIDNNDDEEADVLPDRPVHSNAILGVKRQLKINKKKRKQTFTNNRKLKRQRTSVVHSGQNQHISCTNSTISNEINLKDILNKIENQIIIHQNMITKTLKRMERKFDHHLGTNYIEGSKILNQYRTEKGEVFPLEYKYQNKNLLNIPAKDIFDFSRRILRILFSPEELKTHILPPERDHLRRPSLDQERFNILLEVLRIKFRLDSDLVQQCFNDLLRTKLSNFLYEERRRESRRKIREHENKMSKQSMLQTAPYDHQESFNGECEETD